MKNIVISADGDRMVYSVPDEVGKNLRKYCMEFLDWLYTNPKADKYRMGGAYCYNEQAFVEYLNKIVYKKEVCIFVENLGWIDFNLPLPDKYKDCQFFNF